MKPPPFLLGAALLFWGAYAGLLAAAAPMALAIEGARFSPWRFSLEAKDFYRVADLCTLLLVGIIAYHFLGTPFPEAMFALLLSLPFAVFPLLLAQFYSTRERIPLEALFLTLRNAGRVAAEPLPQVNLGYPFAALCLLAAAAANPRTAWFYAGVIGFAAWALWPARPRRRTHAAWAALLLLAAGLGYLGQLGLSRLQGVIEEAVTAWLIDQDSQTDPFRSSTRIGSLGALKLSDRVILRVAAARAGDAPPRLQEAIYNLFDGRTWFARGGRFDPLPPEDDHKTWNFGAQEGAEKSVAISAYLRGGEGVLALPENTWRISALPAGSVERGNLGAVRVMEAPGFVFYRAHYGALPPAKPQPESWDTQIPKAVDKALGRIAAELHLAEKPPRQALAAIEAFFRRDFAYSLSPADGEGSSKSIGDFLTRSRSGHCEYFATATVLLLRKAGIPARYAVGYAVQEYSPWQRQYLVRTRHAHAWALAFIDGVWREVDTTPSTWAAQEEQRASWWQPLLDAGSHAYYLFSRWRWAEREEGPDTGLAWLALPLTAFLLWRIFRRKKVRGAIVVPPAAGVRRESTAFYRVTECIERVGHARGRGETLTRWLKRIEAEPPVAETRRELEEMLRLHYRLRFDPGGATEQDRTKLESLAEAWLGALPRLCGKGRFG